MKKPNRAALAALSLGVALLVVACDRPAPSSEGSGAARDQAPARPGAVIDSTLPQEELVRRFRVGVDSVDSLAGPTSRDELVRQFLDGVRRNDRAAVQRLGITKAEFAYLVFPGSKISKPPYNQPPDIEWLLLQQSSGSGLTRLLKRAGAFEFRTYVCEQPPVVDGGAKYWPGCVVRVMENGTERRLRLFGAIVEMKGRFKFRDFSNAF